MINLSAGYTDLTTFRIESSALSSFDVNWGDGTFSETEDYPFTHIYDSAGAYSITLNSCDELSSFEVCVEDYLKPTVSFITAPVSANPGCGETFSINVSSLNENMTLHFYASGSDSDPYQTPQHFWSHLKPQWNFEKNGIALATADLVGSPVLSGSTTVGYSANYTFDYYDEMPGSPILFVTLEQAKGVNSRVYAATQHTIESIIPTEMNITGDGINPISRIQYEGVNIPFVISVDAGCSNIMHYAEATITDAKIYGKCFSVDENSVSSINDLDISLTDSNCFSTGGYLISSLKIPKGTLPPIKQTATLAECQFDTIERETTRQFAYNVYIHVEADVIINNNTYSLSGNSNTFNIYPDGEFYKFRRQNESESLAQKLFDFSFTDNLKESTMLWDYMNALFDATNHDSLGVKSGFGIGNFTTNHQDIERCRVRSLKDSAQMLDVPMDDYNLDLPQDVERIMDLVSIPQERIIGSRCVCNNNFIDCDSCCGTNVCTRCGYDKTTNVGDQLTLTNTVTAGVPILYKEKGSQIFEIYNILPQGGETIMTVGSLSSGPLNGKDNKDFCFFEWNNSAQNNPIESEIDYQSEFTTISKGLTSIDDWYSEDGIIEEMFTNVLIDGLDLDA